MTGRAKKEKAFSRLPEFVTSSVPADQVWDQALSVVERGADLRAKSKARLADAQVARAQAESVPLVTTAPSSERKPTNIFSKQNLNFLRPNRSKSLPKNVR